MILEKCHCGGDALMFRKKTMTPDRYRHVKRQHVEKAAELDKKRLTFFWAECLSCGAKSEEGNEYEYAVKNWSEANHDRERKA